MVVFARTRSVLCVCLSKPSFEYTEAALVPSTLTYMSLVVAEVECAKVYPIV